MKVTHFCVFLTAGLQIKFNSMIIPLCLLYLHFLSIQQLHFHYLHLKMLPLLDVFGLSWNKIHIFKATNYGIPKHCQIYFYNLRKLFTKWLQNTEKIISQFNTILRYFHSFLKNYFLSYTVQTDEIVLYILKIFIWKAVWQRPR